MDSLKSPRVSKYDRRRGHRRDGSTGWACSVGACGSRIKNISGCKKAKDGEQIPGKL